MNDNKTEFNYTNSSNPTEKIKINFYTPTMTPTSSNRERSEPTQSPLSTQICFQNNDELKAAVDIYINVSNKLWFNLPPIGSWCVKSH